MGIAQVWKMSFISDSCDERLSRRWIDKATTLIRMLNVKLKGAKTRDLSLLPIIFKRTHTGTFETDNDLMTKSEKFSVFSIVTSISPYLIDPLSGQYWTDFIWNAI